MYSTCTCIIYSLIEYMYSIVMYIVYEASSQVIMCTCTCIAVD